MQVVPVLWCPCCYYDRAVASSSSALSTSAAAPGWACLSQTCCKVRSQRRARAGSHVCRQVQSVPYITSVHAHLPSTGTSMERACGQVGMHVEPVDVMPTSGDEMRTHHSLALAGAQLSPLSQLQLPSLIAPPPAQRPHAPVKGVPPDDGHHILPLRPRHPQPGQQREAASLALRASTSGTSSTSASAAAAPQVHLVVGGCAVDADADVQLA